ncbi:MAG: peptidoglycan DD-metalloendopeptidase family protein, partial [Oscillospiraceae bacterium]|nr:peptidoglycan DD-metalloendopeptidase family protein [Oscillospiraceae bacterium]
APVKAGTNAVLLTGAAVVHDQMKEGEEDNAAIEAADSTLTTTGTVRLVHQHHKNRSHDESEKSQRLTHEEEQTGRIHFESKTNTKRADSPNTDAEKQRKQAVRHNQKKKQVREGYYAEKHNAERVESAGNAVSAVFEKVMEVVQEKKHTIFVLLALLFMVMFLMTQLASCGAMITGAVDYFLETSWLNDDADINKAEVYYTKLEAELAQNIGRSSVLHPNFDEYRFDLDEIGHDPVELISYLSAEAENGIFEYNADLEAHLREIFAEQYALDYTELSDRSTTTRTVRVGESIGQVVTSAYCNCAICCGQWAGSPTESGVMPTANHTLAVDLYDPIVPMGTQIVMNGILYKVEDTGYLNRYGVNFDVYMDSHATAQMWGHKTFEAFLYDANGSETVTVTDTSTRSVLSISLRKKSLDEIAHHNLNLIQEEQYGIYKESGGNRAFLTSPVADNWKGSVSGCYGYRYKVGGTVAQHNDLLIAQPTGRAVNAPFDGTVTKIGSNATLGTYITIKKDDYTVTFGHLRSVSVTERQEVTKGSMVGRVGSTGNVTEPSLSVSFQYRGEDYNPYFYFLSAGS